MAKLNKMKKKLYYEAKIKDIKNDGTKKCRTLNSTPSFIESDGLFITKPFDVANYFNDYFIGKVGKLRQEMPTTNSEQLYLCIKSK